MIFYLFGIYSISFSPINNPNQIYILILQNYQQLIQLLSTDPSMKSRKPQSVTTDTRLTQSQFFNNSLLNKTNLTTSSQKQHQVLHSFQQEDSKQTDFLKVKNIHLIQRINRMAQQIKQLQNNKIHLLSMNQKYVQVINQFYQDSHIHKSFIQNSQQQLYASTKIHFRPNENHMHKQERKSLHKKQRPRSKQNSNTSTKESSVEVVLNKLQKDHRNLSKHCLVMQSQIKNYAAQMEKFNQMKAQLFAVNHTSPKELIIQLQQLTDQNKELKKQNNRLNFELQKIKSQCNKLKKSKQTQNKSISSNNDELEKLKAQIIKITQQSSDKANQYQQRIYELQLKSEKLENQLRNSQIFIGRNREIRKNLQIDRVEDIHENCFLKTNLSELLDPKKHALVKIDRSFIYKKKRQRSISLNKVQSKNLA